MSDGKTLTPSNGVRDNTARQMRVYKRAFFLVPIIITLQTLRIPKFLITLIYSFVAKHLPTVIRTPDERFAGLDKLGYPFRPNYVELVLNETSKLPRVHYLDEGPKDASEVMLCCHGEPSWSFLYRKMIPPFVNAGYRVVVPDFIGFGKSDKYTSMGSYTQEMHTTTLKLLIEHLSLRNITLVCQDWGGLTGLSVVKDMPDRFARIVVMNTGLPTGDMKLGLFQLKHSLFLLARGVPFLLWRSAVQLLGTCLPIGYTFGQAKVPKEAIPGYVAPFPSSDYKAGAAKWPLLVPVLPSDPLVPDMEKTRDFFRDNWSKPTLVMFSDRDPITKGIDKFFTSLIPHSNEVTVHGAGHFLQETHGDELAANIEKFVGGQLKSNL